MTYVTSEELERPKRVFKSAPIKKTNLEIPNAAEEKLAGVKAEKIVRDAKLEAELTSKTASSQAAEVTRKAHDAGYKEGYENGFAQAKQDAHARFDQLLNGMNQALEEVQLMRNELCENLKETIILLGLDIAAKTLKQEIRTNRDVVNELAKQVLCGIAPVQDAVLKVNPSDYEAAKDFEQEFESAAGYPEKFKISSDPSLDQGDVVVLYERGTVDARISTQLENIVRALLGSDF
jgi:flagellar assembly protein FliH